MKKNVRTNRQEDQWDKQPGITLPKNETGNHSMEEANRTRTPPNTISALNKVRRKKQQDSAMLLMRKSPRKIPRGKKST